MRWWWLSRFRPVADLWHMGGTCNSGISIHAGHGHTANMLKLWNTLEEGHCFPQQENNYHHLGLARLFNSESTAFTFYFALQFPPFPSLFFVCVYMCVCALYTASEPIQATEYFRRRILVFPSLTPTPSWP